MDEAKLANVVISCDPTRYEAFGVLLKSPTDSTILRAYYRVTDTNTPGDGYDATGKAVVKVLTNGGKHVPASDTTVYDLDGTDVYPLSGVCYTNPSGDEIEIIFLMTQTAADNTTCRANFTKRVNGGAWSAPALVTADSPRYFFGTSIYDPTAHRIYFATCDVMSPGVKQTYLEYSDDDGATWTELTATAAAPVGTTEINECSLQKCTDGTGRILMLYRNMDVNYGFYKQYFQPSDNSFTAAANIGLNTAQASNCALCTLDSGAIIVVDRIGQAWKNVAGDGVTWAATDRVVDPTLHGVGQMHPSAVYIRPGLIAVMWCNKITGASPISEMYMNYWAYDTSAAVSIPTGSGRAVNFTIDKTKVTATEHNRIVSVSLAGISDATFWTYATAANRISIYGINGQCPKTVREFNAVAKTGYVDFAGDVSANYSIPYAIVAGPTCADSALAYTKDEMVSVIPLNEASGDFTCLVSSKTFVGAASFTRGASLPCGTGVTSKANAVASVADTSFLDFDGTTSFLSFACYHKPTTVNASSMIVSKRKNDAAAGGWQWYNYWSSSVFNHTFWLLNNNVGDAPRYFGIKTAHQHPNANGLSGFSYAPYRNWQACHIYSLGILRAHTQISGTSTMAGSSSQTGSATISGFDTASSEPLPGNMAMLMTATSFLTQVWHANSKAMWETAGFVAVGTAENLVAPSGSSVSTIRQHATTIAYWW